MADDNIKMNSIAETEGTIPAGLPGNIMRKRMEDGNNKALMLVGTGRHTDYTYLDSSGVSQTVLVYETEPIQIIESSSTEPEYMLRTTEDSIAFCPVDNSQIEKGSAQWANVTNQSKLNFSCRYDDSTQDNNTSTVVSKPIERNEEKILIYKIKIEAEVPEGQNVTKHYIIDGGFVVIYPTNKKIDYNICIGCGYTVSGEDTLIGGVTISADISTVDTSKYIIVAQFDKVTKWAKISWKRII